MKPKKMVKKLELKKQRIVNLTVDEKSLLKGGVVSIPSGCTGITCDWCNSDISCIVNKCDWCETEVPSECVC